MFTINIPSSVIKALVYICVLKVNEVHLCNLRTVSGGCDTFPL